MAIVNQELSPAVYESRHIEAVTVEIQQSIDRYFASFAPDRATLKSTMTEAINAFKKEQAKYQHLFDEDTLEDFEYDPNSFKGALKSKCPIILRCLNSPSEAMDGYRRDFYRTSGETMLTVTKAIVTFGKRFVRTFQATHYLAGFPGDLGVAELDKPDYSAPSMLGGGVRSHFLYQLYPHIFPNRSQNAVWALYFLSNRKDFGLSDGSEFLMIEETGTQQNYYYPYELFTYYVNLTFKELDQRCIALPYAIDSAHRYVCVNRFFDHIADEHRPDINLLLPTHERIDY